MSNPLERRRNLLEEQNYKSNFNFTEFNIVDKDKSELLVLEEKIKSSQMTFVKSTLEIGNILSQAQDKLKSYGTGSFMKWYENIGFNKDNVSYFLKSEVRERRFEYSTLSLSGNTVRTEGSRPSEVFCSGNVIPMILCFLILFLFRTLLNSTSDHVFKESVYLIIFFVLSIFFPTFYLQ
jgi:hypothetical protein